MVNASKIREREQTGQKEWSLSQILYVFLMGGLLCSYLIIQAYDHESFSLPAWIAAVRIVAAISGIWLGKIWKDRGFLLIISLILIQIIRVVAKDAQLLFSDTVSTSVLNGLWVIGGCYSLGRILSTKQLKQLLKVLAAVWTTGIVIHCLIALYGAWTDQEIINLHGGSIWTGGSIWGIIWEERLIISFLYPTMSGSVLSVYGVVILLVLITARRKAAKVLYGLALLIVIITLSLTDARTSYISFSAGCGVMVGIYILHYIRNKDARTKCLTGGHEGNKSYSWLIAGISAVMVCVISIIVISKITPLFNQLKTKGGLLYSIAYAEDQATTKLQVVSRGFGGSDVLSGRITIWKNIINYIFTDPIRLFFGTSIHDPMAGPNQMMGYHMAHCHNMTLQILLESGIIGLALVFVFGFYTARNGFQIIKTNTIPLWIKLVPAFAFSVLVGDLAECIGGFHEWKGPALPFLFVACGIINVVGAKDKIKNT